MTHQKLPMLLWLIKNEPFERMIIFGNWKEKNIDLVDHLYEYGIKADDGFPAVKADRQACHIVQPGVAYPCKYYRNCASQ